MSTAPRMKENNILVTEQLLPEEVLRVALEQGYQHVCQKNGLEFDRELQAAEALTRQPENLFKFPMATIFAPNDINSATEQKYRRLVLDFISTEQKEDLLAGQLMNHMTSASFSQTLMEEIHAVADEMFTNALYNAPFIDVDSGLNPNLSRKDLEITMVDGEKGQLCLGYDESRVVITCSDPFGTLNLQRYLNKARSSYLAGPAASMNFGPGGAGLGSYIILNTGASIYLGVQTKKATIMACVLPLKMSQRKRQALGKHLHWIHF